MSYVLPSTWGSSHILWMGICVGWSVRWCDQAHALMPAPGVIHRETVLMQANALICFPRQRDCPRLVLRIRLLLHPSLNALLDGAPHGPGVVVRRLLGALLRPISSLDLMTRHPPVSCGACGG